MPQRGGGGRWVLLLIFRQYCFSPSCLRRYTECDFFFSWGSMIMISFIITWIILMITTTRSSCDVRDWESPVTFLEQSGLKSESSWGVSESLMWDGARPWMSLTWPPSSLQPVPPPSPSRTRCSALFFSALVPSGMCLIRMMPRRIVWPSCHSQYPGHVNRAAHRSIMLSTKEIKQLWEGRMAFCTFEVTQPSENM